VSGASNDFYELKFCHRDLANIYNLRNSRRRQLRKFGSGDNFCNLERFSSQAAGNICEIDGKIVGGWEMV